ncbi:hybrid sensor histidine kinase/response regulator transcription factor [Arenibacter aquaticus]|nr:hybrid sensor histidine kinase/response regulator transcription factor [Arenibacter aquaticus]
MKIIEITLTMGYKLQILMALTVSVWNLNAQSLKFEHYNDNNGLSHNSVRHIVQDDNGFLWLGTFSGLNRFDGYEFKTFTSASAPENSIPDDDITDLELDRELNHLWIGTRKGLVRYNLDTHTFHNFLPKINDPNALQDGEIRAVHVDRYKQVWVGTKDNGLFVYNPEEQRFNKIVLDGYTYIKEIFEDSEGHLWIGSYGSAGVAKISLDNLGNIAQVKEYNLTIPESTEINPYINFIYEDHKSDIFVGSRRGLYKLDVKADSFENLYIEDAEIRDKLGPYFISVARAPNGEYWLGTLGGILVVDEIEQVGQQNYRWYYSELSDDDSLVDNLVAALYFDAAGVLWIGTEDGLEKYDPYNNQFKYNADISRYIGNQVPRIRGFAKTKDDRIIVATRHNGLFISNDGEFVPLFNNNKDIVSIYTNDGNIFYCGLWEGQVLRYDYSSAKATVLDVGFSQSPVLAFAHLNNNTMVVGSHGEGSVIINTVSLQPVKGQGILLPSRSINNCVIDSVGTIWYATQTGVVRYDPKGGNIVAYEADNGNKTGLSHGNVSDIAIDPSGKIWAGTRKGLDYYDPDLDEFVPILNPAELHNSWVTDVVAESHGVLWLNMNNNRVARYNSISNELKIYYTDSGNRLDVFSLTDFYYADDSHVYLGGKNEIISFSPKDIQDNDYSPPPIITDIRIQNTDLEVGGVFNDQQILTTDLNVSRELVLENDNKNFSLTFSSPSYTNERFNKYSYRLAGFDEGWTTVDMRQRTVQYTNLFFGDYTFEVKAMNSYGVWSDISSFRIEILPPFWLTYQAFILLLVVLSVLFYVVRKQIKSRLQLKQQLLLEKVKRERDEKLNNEKLRFFTNISHELRTPLTLILGPTKQLIDESKGTGNQFHQSRYNMILQNANRLLNLVNQVLDFRRAQSGELRLRVTQTDILLHTRNTFRSFEELADDKKIEFNLICESNTIEGYIDRDKYDKMLYNLLSNALKFTHKYGHVDLFVGTKLEDSKAILVVEISDDGIGIPLESQEKIFSRFYQAANSKENNTGSGIGLSLVQVLVQLHKGTIAVQSKPQKGSVFTLKIPIDRKAYGDHEVFELGKSPVIEHSPHLISSKKIIKSTHLKERILIVEDNVELRSYLVDYLSDYYKVFEAENGQKGLDICRQIKPALCVADIMMPVMDGLEFCKELKNDGDISHIPVILLTALSDNDDKIRGYSSGADGYLVKPFDPSLLKTRIENIIHSRMDLKGKFSGEVESKAITLTHSPVDEKFMQKLIKLIEDDLGNMEMSTTYLCQELGMSSSKLYRKIKELTDLAPNEFIRTIRLKKAAQLLGSKKYNVSEVATMVGFNDPLYFSRCFKKQFGYPPSNLVKH